MTKLGWLGKHIESDYWTARHELALIDMKYPFLINARIDKDKRITFQSQTISIDFTLETHPSMSRLGQSIVSNPFTVPDLYLSSFKVTCALVSVSFFPTSEGKYIPMTRQISSTKLWVMYMYRPSYWVMESLIIRLSNTSNGCTVKWQLNQVHSRIVLYRTLNTSLVKSRFSWLCNHLPASFPSTCLCNHVREHSCQYQAQMKLNLSSIDIHVQTEDRAFNTSHNFCAWLWINYISNHSKHNSPGQYSY